MLSGAGAQQHMIKLILLDRDGVLNADSADYIKSPQEWQPLPQAGETIASLQQRNRQVAICTNQSGLARGLFDARTLSAIHAKLGNYLGDFSTHIDHIYWCPHGPTDNCNCRKPQPGMLLNAMADFHASPAQTCFVGDSLRDLQAAQAAQCLPVLVLTGNGAATAATLQQPEHAALAASTKTIQNLSGLLELVG